jgi:hypothetical protein
MKIFGRTQLARHYTHARGAEISDIGGHISP